MEVFDYVLLGRDLHDITNRGNPAVAAVKTAVVAVMGTTI